ncbi:MAG: DUF465 domain-containing protein [Deltaproteobacteria bacterium]|jgi:uncharacterized protein YdcH (DUF465 family)|nr:DUF465 domain-containing protein [Deltaproteobacteria bacterium]
MDTQEIQLVEKYSVQDTELKRLWEEHQLYEKQLEKLEKKSFLTPVEEKQVRELKKQKLDGKTQLVEHLQRYKQS